jgi:hypothetical protein
MKLKLRGKIVLTGLIILLSLASHFYLLSESSLYGLNKLGIPSVEKDILDTATDSYNHGIFIKWLLETLLKLLPGGS